jgi:hypothetical protein
MLEPDYHERLSAAEAEHEAVKKGSRYCRAVTIFGSSDYSFI